MGVSLGGESIFSKVHETWNHNLFNQLEILWKTCWYVFVVWFEKKMMMIWGSYKVYKSVPNGAGVPFRGG